MKNRMESMQIDKFQLFIGGGRLSEGNADARFGRAEFSWSLGGSFQQRSMEVK